MVSDDALLNRLAELLGQVSEQLKLLNSIKSAPSRTFEDASTQCGCKWQVRPSDEPSVRIMRALRPPLPDPLLVRKMIRHRQLRARFFDGELFADPAWDMLLDLTVARAENKRVTVTSLCIASGVPATTALRWIKEMVEEGLFQRMDDDQDARRCYVSLTEKAASMVAEYFHSVGDGKPI